MKKEVLFNGRDLSKITQNDLSKIYPTLNPLLISTDENIKGDKLRVLELLVFAENYNIGDLQSKLATIYKKVYPDIF
ncbi:hypothetical protein CQ046_10915 [Chryseobacterium sp. MYb7]|uniref:hypothetical protein n=1 Tax=Chryseobacterium sp. MYb7 TaxID=1827290 RepID=UPI000CFF8C1F|nr:hypothetical protein [Chryseobacterium sp. MYb7]PRB03058.1 hypothetical protein CQ046_10915 [Chryseobacterium sp. MYb7]